MTRPDRVVNYATQPEKQGQPDAPPIALQPRKRLFYMLLSILLGWMIILLTLYFTTVYGKSDVHGHPPATQTYP